MPNDALKAELEKIPTRFKLDEKNVKLLIDSAGAILRRNSTYQRFLGANS
jgi:NTE family protein